MAAALTACRRPTENAPPGALPPPIPVTLAGVTNAAWDRTVSIVGTLYPKDTATIAAQVDGIVERTLVDFGDRVEAGATLAAIDTAFYEAQLAQQSGNLARAEASLVNSRQDYERIQNLGRASIASAADLDRAQAAQAEAEAAVKAARGAEAVARLNLERSQIRAPFPGGISQRFATRGDYVKVGAPLFELVNDAVLKFIFAVPERYASSVTKTLPVSFEVDDRPGEHFDGRVYLVSPSVATSSRAFNVGALVTNTITRLKANSFARGTLVLEQGVPTPVIPVEAVVSFAGITKVFTVEGGRARSRIVTLGRTRGGLQEVTAGLKPGESVVVGGATRLTDDLPVQVTGPESSP